MSMFEMIRTQMAKAVPFAAHTGVEPVEVAPGRGTARLVSRPETGNHLGTVHAGALFTLGETASGAAMTGAFATRILSLRPVAGEARITYTRPARGTLTASAICSETPEALNARLDAEGKIWFDVTVSIVNEQGEPVAALVVAWQVRKA